MPESARGLGQADLRTQAAFQDLTNRLHEAAAAIQDRLKVFNLQPQRMYGQYRWYIPPGSPLESLPAENTPSARDMALLLQPWQVSPVEVEAITRYPGCFVWSLHQRGIRAAGAGVPAG